MFLFLTRNCVVHTYLTHKDCCDFDFYKCKKKKKCFAYIRRSAIPPEEHEMIDRLPDKQMRIKRLGLDKEDPVDDTSKYTNGSDKSHCTYYIHSMSVLCIVVHSLVYERTKSKFLVIIL
jgi:hypothetical protein